MISSSYIRPSLWLHTLFICGLLFTTTVVLAETSKGTAGPSSGKPEQQFESSMANIDAILETLEDMSQEVASSKEKSSLNHNSVLTIRDGLSSIEEKLKEAYSGLDESRTGIGNNTSKIDKAQEELLSLAREIRTNAADLDSQKSLIEDNAIRLYEILIRISSMKEQVKNLAESLQSLRNTNKDQEAQLSINDDLDQLWRLLATILACFTPLAFVLTNQNTAPLSDGIARSQGVLLVSLGALLAYSIIGFSLIFGISSSGLIGTTHHLWGSTEAESTLQATEPLIAFLLYQAGFVILGTLIVYQILGRQLSSTKHLLLALLMGAFVIPLFAHWTWASYFIPGNKGWLEGAGFQDQTGSVTIHVVAAWFALVLVWKLAKPASTQDKQNTLPPVYTSAAVLLLWVSWIGLSAGRLSVTGEQISVTLLNIALASAMGSIAAYLHYAFFHTDKNHLGQSLNTGFMSGLVAIAACAQSVTLYEAMLIGMVAGVLQNIAFRILRNTLLRATWQTPAAHMIAIHGIAGIWGGLSMGLFSTENSFSAPNMTQLITQTQGIAAAIAYSLIMAHLVAFLLTMRNTRKP